VAARIAGDTLSVLTNVVPAFTTVVAEASAPDGGTAGGVPTGAIVFLVFVVAIVLLGMFVRKTGRGGGSSGGGGASRGW